MALVASRKRTSTEAETEMRARLERAFPGAYYTLLPSMNFLVVEQLPPLAGSADVPDEESDSADSADEADVPTLEPVEPERRPVVEGEWRRAVLGFCPGYEVSTEGVVRVAPTGRQPTGPRKPGDEIVRRAKTGCVHVSLYSTGTGRRQTNVAVAQTMVRTFMPDVDTREFPHVAFADGDYQNCRLANLRPVRTHHETGRPPTKPGKFPVYKMEGETVVGIYASIAEAAEANAANVSTISNCHTHPGSMAAGYNWRRGPSYTYAESQALKLRHI